jgi:hypothetical protein
MTIFMQLPTKARIKPTDLYAFKFNTMPTIRKTNAATNRTTVKIKNRVSFMPIPFLTTHAAIGKCVIQEISLFAKVR